MPITEKSRGLDSADPMGSRTQDLCKCAWWWNSSRVSFHGQERGYSSLIHDPRVTCPPAVPHRTWLEPSYLWAPSLGCPGGQCQWEQVRALIYDLFCAQGTHTPLLLMAPHEHPPTYPLQQTASQVIHQPDTSTPGSPQQGRTKRKTNQGGSWPASK